MPDPPTMTPTATPTPTPALPPATCSAAAPSSHPPSPCSSPESVTAQSISTAQPATLNISTSDTSSTNNPAVGQDDSTPPTSAISSSQEESGGKEVSPMKVEAGPEESAGVSIRKEAGQVLPRLGSSSQSPPPESVAGTKRTASGEVKRSSVNGMGDVITNSLNDASHSRTSSMTSNGANGNVLELSQQLRTKLKYAMLKVQNGWQSRSFEEIESLASQSPRSTVSGVYQSNNAVLSPKTAMMSRKLYQRESSESDSSDSTVALETRSQMMTQATGSPQTSTRHRSLAPPVDIMPAPAFASRRRPATNTVYHGPPRVRTTADYFISGKVGPSSRPSTSQRTPSQNAAMEADAVETLLFMASPNNSGYKPPSQASQESFVRTSAAQPPSSASSTMTSPLRTQFSQTSILTSPKRVAFSDTRSSSADRHHHGHGHDVIFDKAALIDRMLDDLSDTSDEELEEAFRLAEKSKPAAAVSS